MTSLADKIAAFQSRLDEVLKVFNSITNSLITSEHPQRQSDGSATSCKRPEWVDEIVLHFHEISTGLKSVKQTLEARVPGSGSHSSGDTAASTIEAVPETALHHEDTLQDQRAARGLPAFAQNAQQESVAPMPQSQGGAHLQPRLRTMSTWRTCFLRSPIEGQLATTSQTDRLL